MTSQADQHPHDRTLDITVVGLGYVGAVTAACLARRGHRVVGVDIDERKLGPLREGRSPILEPHLDELVAAATSKGLLRVTDDITEAVRSTELSVVCVGTPGRENGSVELSYLERVSRDVAQALVPGRFHSVVYRSTMPPGTVDSVLIPQIEAVSGLRVVHDVGVAMCPEFLREGSGIEDFDNPPFVVAGTRDEITAARIRAMFAHVDAPTHFVDIRTAEALKYACNAFHATKVSFANEIGRFCQASGADARVVMRIFCEDDRLNLSSYYLRPGFSFGGSCLPKDLRAMLHRARMLDVELPLLDGVLASNDRHLRHAIERVLHSGARRVALLGLSFKPGTDDLRESPYVELAETLIGKGIELAIYDEHIRTERLFGANLAYVSEQLPHLGRILTDSPEAALRDAELAIVAAASQRVRDALLARRIPTLDLCGGLGPAVEALPEYAGIAW
ncbi:MAG TPA: nucleotide sugar dehydrogenase [Acidimicrobiales bacterium]